MNNAFLPLFIIFLIISVGIYGYSIYRSVCFVRSKIKTDNKKEFKILGYLGIAFIVSCTITFASIHPWCNHAVVPIDWFWTIFGGITFSATIYLELHSFIIHYYKKGLDPKTDKKLFVTLMICIVAFIVTSLFLTNGFADYWNLTKPLVSGISFTNGLTYPGQSAHIKLYAIFILSGAIFVYFYADHKMYIEYGKHNLLESTFFIAFPAGIIGARLWYCIGENVPFQDWYKIWKGGLTILGGAIVGIVVGVLWFKWRHSDLSIWVTVDICVPSILLAQAIGRLGNFTNLEVYGQQCSDVYWQWLPKIIFNNMHFTTSSRYSGCMESEIAGVYYTPGMIFPPLFFIEGIVNVVGFAVLAHLIRNRLKKYVEVGDAAFGYLIWYGFTRVFMEPLRDPAYNMGDKGYWSWIWSIIFVGTGILLIALNHLIRYLIKNKKKQIVVTTNMERNNLIASIVISVLGITFTVIGIIAMATNTFSPSVALNGYNLGLTSLVFGIGILTLLAASIPYFIHAKKDKKQTC